MVRCHNDLIWNRLHHFDLKMTEREALPLQDSSFGRLLTSLRSFEISVPLKPHHHSQLYSTMGFLRGLLFGYRDNMELREMQHLVFVAFLTLMIRLELIQRTKDDVTV